MECYAVLVDWEGGTLFSLSLALNTFGILMSGPVFTHASVGTSHGPMSVCHKLVFCQTDGRNNLGFGVGAYFDQSYAVF